MNIHSRFGFAVVACAFGLLSVGALANPPDKPYPVEIVPGFQSKVTVDDIERTALEGLSRPLALKQGQSGELLVEPPPAQVLRIVGCKGADLRAIDPRVSPRDDEYIWYVHARGTFSLPHMGEMSDTEGYFLVDPRTGLFVQTGVFLPPPEAADEKP